MAEPRIQYAKTKDGVSIAYATTGEGMPLVRMPTAPYSHVQLESKIPELRQWNEQLAEGRMLVRYDCRGAGLSDRNVSDYSLDTHILDLEAVVDHVRLKRFALLAGMDMGPVALAFTARHANRVSHLVLWATWAATSDPPWLQSLDELLRKDWRAFTETVAHGVLGWTAGEEANRFAEFMRESVSPDVAMAAHTAANEFDVTDLLPQVKSPTLILHPGQAPWPPLDMARELASQIPDARLAVWEGKSILPQVENMEDIVRPIGEFLATGKKAAEAARPLAAEDIHTILFTDVEGSTALTQRLGDAKARDLLREHEHIVREALKAHGGSEVKTMGDGFMASFSSATKALECAIAMQRAFAEHDESAEEPIKVRVGLNAGEPIAEDEDLFGTAVNEAARITAAAKGGEILVSNVVRELAKGKDFLFADRGEASLKGFDEPLRLYELRWREAG